MVLAKFSCCNVKASAMTSCNYSMVVNNFLLSSHLMEHLLALTFLFVLTLSPTFSLRDRQTQTLPFENSSGGSEGDGAPGLSRPFR